MTQRHSHYGLDGSLFGLIVFISRMFIRVPGSAGELETACNHTGEEKEVMIPRGKEKGGHSDSLQSAILDNYYFFLV